MYIYLLSGGSFYGVKLARPHRRRRRRTCQRPVRRGRRHGVSPILSRFGTLEQRRLYATCVGVIFPVCAVSAAVYLWRGEIELMTALPYLIGGPIGGWLGGKLYGKVSVKLLKWMFAAFLFYAGVRYLL